MTTITNELVRVIVSLMIIAASVAVYTTLGKQPTMNRVPEPPELLVEATSAIHQDGKFRFEVDGVVVPFREVNVAAEVSGRVVYKAPGCRPGEPVREGDLLFKIDPREYELEIDRLKAAVEQADGSMEELQEEETSAEKQIELAEDDLDIRKREWQRFKDAEGKRIFSRAEFDVAERNKLLAENSLQSRKDQLQLVKSRKTRIASAAKSARTALELAELDLERCSVRSRVTGVIVSESVQQEGFVQKGGVLMMIRDTSKMEVRCNLRMQQLQWLWESQRHNNRVLARQHAEDNPSEYSVDDPATSDPQSLPTSASSAPPTRSQAGYEFPTTSADVLFEIGGVFYRWTGELARYADSGVDQRTRMIPCIVEVDDPDKVIRVGDGARTLAAPPTLLSGMFVTVSIVAELQRPLLKLPVTSVAPGGEVWYINEDSVLSSVSANVIQANDDFVIVEQDPNLAQFKIVTSPLVSPIAGTPANILNEGTTDDRVPSGRPSGDPSGPLSPREGTNKEGAE